METGESQRLRTIGRDRFGVWEPPTAWFARQARCAACSARWLAPPLAGDGAPSWPWGRANNEAVAFSASFHEAAHDLQAKGRHAATQLRFRCLIPNSWEEDDVPGRSVWLRVLGVADSVLERLVEEPDGSVVAHVRPKRRRRQRCGICGRRSPVYDQGGGRRRWRGLDVGCTRFLVEAAAPRVTCQVHGVVVAQVPWARHGSRFLRAFEDQVAWLATQCSQKACSQLMRLDWETVGRIITRVVEETSRTHDRLDGLERIGIDEISWRRGQRYLTLVIDHTSGRLVWAAEGRSKKVVESFFAQLGPERCAQLTHVSSDGAEWILAPIGQHCPNATICLDPFHVVQWATNALDNVRKAIWHEVRRSGQHGAAAEIKGSRWRCCETPKT